MRPGIGLACFVVEFLGGFLLLSIWIVRKLAVGFAVIWINGSGELEARQASMPLSIRLKNMLLRSLFSIAEFSGSRS